MGNRLTVTELQKRIATMVDEKYSTPTVGGEEWNLRLSLLNQAQDEWSSAHEWESMRKVFVPTITSASGLASISLPADFMEFAENPRLHTAGSDEGTEWQLIKPQDRDLYVSSSEYAYKIGNPADGYTLIWHPGSLSSGASISVPYYAMPTSLASPADITQIDTPEYLVKRAIAMRWEIANDPRYQQMESKAREILMQAIENDNAQAEPIDDSVRTPSQNIGFRLGRD